jgi:hypothetical protein
MSAVCPRLSQVVGLHADLSDRMHFKYHNNSYQSKSRGFGGNEKLIYLKENDSFRCSLTVTCKDGTTVDMFAVNNEPYLAREKNITDKIRDSITMTSFGTAKAVHNNKIYATIIEIEPAVFLQMKSETAECMSEIKIDKDKDILLVCGYRFLRAK